MYSIGPVYYCTEIHKNHALVHNWLRLPRVSAIQATAANVAEAAKQVPTYKIIFSNFPPPTLNPVVSCIYIPLAEGVMLAVEERAVDMGVLRMFPIPRDNKRYPNIVVAREGSSSRDEW
jgi:hypothetical protein